MDTHISGFKIITEDNIEIVFAYYPEDAPITCSAFSAILPFTRTFYHARISGQEIWIDDVPPLDIIQENASVFTNSGEVVFGPSKPERTKTANCFGIYYGEGRGLDAANIFAKVVDDDFEKLIDLGNKIWKKGGEKILVTTLQ
ncbi:MAG: DUF3830 family protein [Saprospiraceae bacterium]|nr:DUF3830 family protein [Saprospiraceae bacterium]